VTPGRAPTGGTGRPDRPVPAGQDPDPTATPASLTLQDAAERLGVHYMTVYRYLRTGRLTATWREGRWWVPLAEVEVLAERLANPPPRGRRPADQVAAPGEDRPRPVDPEAVARLERRLRSGDEPGAWVLLEALLLAGHGVVDVLTDALAPAMRSLGERWATGDLSVAEEHLASQVAERLVARLGSRSRRPGRHAEVVALAAPSGELHRLPLAMAVNAVRAAGFEALDLGCDLPPEELARLVRRPPRPVAAVVLGASVPAHQPALAAAVRAVRQAAPGVPVLLGGAAVPGPTEAQALGADGWSGPDARSLVASLQALFGRERPVAGGSGG